MLIEMAWNYFSEKHLQFLQSDNITNFWGNLTTKSISQKWTKIWTKLEVEKMKNVCMKAFFIHKK
jgi:hypothetical protein